MNRLAARAAAAIYRTSGTGYGLVARASGVIARLKGRAECTRCVQHTGIPGVRIGRDGLCTDCALALARIDRRAGEASAARFFDGLGRGTHNVLVSVSGGKDSLAALILAAAHAGARPRAMLLDHGFIPADVLRGAAALCARLDVPLEIVRADVRSALAAAWRRPGLNPFPCFPCCEAQARAILEICAREQIRHVVTGLRWLWEDRFLPVTDASFAYRHFRAPARPEIHLLNILAAEGVTEAAERGLIAAHGGTVRQVGGDSTCCELFGLFERAHLDRFGCYWEGERFLSREIRAGVLTRGEARAKLARPDITAEFEAEVLRKLGL